MVRRVEWLVPADIYILQFFIDHDIVLSPKVVAVNIDYDQSYVGKRCRVLTEKGLLVRQRRGLYRITEIGKTFIDRGFDTTVIDLGLDGEQ